MKKELLLMILGLGFLVVIPREKSAQFKEAAQLVTLSPTYLVIYNGGLENYQKIHYSLSTIGYIGVTRLRILYGNLQ